MGETAMTLEQAAKIAVVLAQAHGGCDICAGMLAHSMEEAFPDMFLKHTWEAMASVACRASGAATEKLPVVLAEYEAEMEVEREAAAEVARIEKEMARSPAAPVICEGTTTTAGNGGLGYSRLSGMVSTPRVTGAALRSLSLRSRWIGTQCEA